MIHLKEVTIDHTTFPDPPDYPFSLPIFQKTQQLEFKTPVTFFVGENGSGKTTLLTALCRKCRIHIWEGRQRRRFNNNHQEHLLPNSLAITWATTPVPGSFFSPELFRNQSFLVDEWAVTDPGILKMYGGESLVSKSHGQSTMAYFESMYRAKGLHFLDEPEAALSPRTQLKLLNLITELSDQGHAQFIISTHSPILMSCPGTTIYSFDGDAVEEMPYRKTMHYQVYQQFFSEG